MKEVSIENVANTIVDELAGLNGYEIRSVLDKVEHLIKIRSVIKPLEEFSSLAQ